MHSFPALAFWSFLVGVGNFVLFVLLAQVVSSAAVDHYGLMGAARRPIDVLRLGGLTLVVAGLALTQLAAQRAAFR